MKKLILVILVLTFNFQLSTMNCAGADDKVVIKKAKSAMAIDGKLEDWKGYEAIKLNTPEQSTNPDKDPKDFSSVCYVAWDKDNLYFAADVIDDLVSCEDITTSDFQHCDYYRFYLDMGNNRNEGSGNMDDDDFEFVFTPSGPDKKPMVREVSKAFGGEGHGLDLSKVKVAAGLALPDKKGWILEAAIPWSMIGTTPKEGTAFGIKFITGDTDQEGQREDEYIWGDMSGSYWQDPTKFGSAILGQ